MLRKRTTGLWLGLVALCGACETDRATPAPGPAPSQPATAVTTPKTPPTTETTPPAPARVGTLLGELTWNEAEKVLTKDAIVVLPLGAASKEHGPHLRLDNDWQLAEYYKERVLQAADVVVAPTLGFHHYPAFVEYPGSTSLSKKTSRNVVVEICRGLARFGPRRFYVLNTGVSTVWALKPAAEALAADGIELRFTNILEIAAPVEQEIGEQPGGTHADEIETSMMLYIAPDSVDMSKAVRDWAPKTKPGFSPTPDGPGHYSKTGIWGDPTLATREKGERVVEAMVAGMLADIEALRAATPPPRQESSTLRAIDPGQRP